MYINELNDVTKRYIQRYEKNTFLIKPPTPSTILTPFLQLMDGGLLNLFRNLKKISQISSLTKNHFVNSEAKYRAGLKRAITILTKVVCIFLLYCASTCLYCKYV